MSLEEEVQRVLAAFSTVFSIQPSNTANTNNEREHANQYLTQFQRSPMAWEIANHLLSTNNSNNANDIMVQTQIHFFAAQTIHMKCRCDMVQLPSETWTSLRDSLLNHLLRFCEASASSNNASGSKPIVSRLAMALCALSVQMNWYDVVDQLILKGNNNTITDAMNMNMNNNNQTNSSSDWTIPNNEPMLNLILEIAQLLPEEATSYRLLVQDPNIRHAFIENLIVKSGNVFDFFIFLIRHCTTSTSSQHFNVLKVQEQLLKCIHSWIRYINVPPQILEESILLEWLFRILSSYSSSNNNYNDNMFELAVDVVIEIIRNYPSDSIVNMKLVHKMIPFVLSLSKDTTTPTSTIVPSCFQKAVQESDEDCMRAYCRIFTEMGESYMSLIMHHEDMNQVELVELVLACSGLPDNEIASITLHFWYRFVSWLEDVQPYEFRQYQIDNFTTQLVKLVMTCTKLLQYPTDIETLLDDQIDDIQRVRFSVCDTLEDCCRLLGGDLVLQNIGMKLQSEIQLLSSIVSQEERVQKWYGIESCLLSLNSTSKYIPNDEKQVIPFVMKLLPDLPTTASYLRTTANHFVGGYAPWLARNSEFLQPILPFLAQGLSEPKCSSSAALAIKYLCESCSSTFSLGDSVLQLYDSILQAQQEQNNSVLDIKDELEVLEGACVAVSRQLDDMVKTCSSQQQTQQQLAETISSYVSRIVGPIGAKLVQYVAPESMVGAKQVITEVERLTVVIRYLRVPDTSGSNSQRGYTAARAKLIIDLMTQCWTWLDELSQKYITDINFAEKICRLHKHCIRGCGAVAYSSLFEKLRIQLVNNYARSHLSPYLYAGSICVSEYGSDPAYEQSLYQTFEAMSQSSFEILRSFDDFRNHPDVVEELFFLAVRMIQSCPRVFVKSPMFHSFLQCAIVGMKQDHTDANRGTLNFLEASFSFGIDLQSSTAMNDAVSVMCKESLEKAIATEGQQIVSNLILALVGELPCYRIACNQGSIAGLFYKLYCLCPTLLMDWIKVSLISVPEGAKSMLISSFTPEASRNEFFDSIERFAFACERTQKIGSSNS